MAAGVCSGVLLARIERLRIRRDDPVADRDRR